MIRKCTEQDFEEIYEIINDGAQAYKGVIPEDRWHDPYMARDELRLEIYDGVAFWGFEENSELIGVMGIQDRADVTLIRHAYVRTGKRNQGIGTALLRHLEGITDGPILIGTWRDATWALRFYQKNGYRLLEEHKKDQLLRRYWRIPARQVETSIVLGNAIWFRREKSS
jgi:GNAT superfamily N-acetyltransferase